MFKSALNRLRRALPLFPRLKKSSFRKHLSTARKEQLIYSGFCAQDGDDSCDSHDFSDYVVVDSSGSDPLRLGTATPPQTVPSISTLSPQSLLDSIPDAESSQSSSQAPASFASSNTSSGKALSPSAGEPVYRRPDSSVSSRSSEKSVAAEADLDAPNVASDSGLLEPQEAVVQVMTGTSNPIAVVESIYLPRLDDAPADIAKSTDAVAILADEHAVEHDTAAISHEKSLFCPTLDVELVGVGCSGNAYKVTRQTWFGKVVRAVKLIDLRMEDQDDLHVYAGEVRTLKELWKHQVYSPIDEDEDEDEHDSDLVRGSQYIAKFSSHENFVGLCGDSYLYTVMEYYPLTLGAFRGLIAHDELALRFIILQTTHGLRFLHSIGIIHMDIKPENIFVTEKGDCVIGDFGGSICNPEKPSQLYRDARGLSFWTPGYVAPEAFNETDPKVNNLSDFWSLGVTIYDLVVAPPIFDDTKTYLEIGLEPFMMAHKMNLYQCSPLIWFMVMGMCEADLDKRWNTRAILGFLKSNFGPLPARSPLLKYDPCPGRVRQPTEKSTNQDVNRSLIRDIVGRGIHSTDRIFAPYIR